jgi:hypothetical protein
MDDGCARAASGQTVADPAITLMKSRRRIAFSKAQDRADLRCCDYTRDLRRAKWGLGIKLHGNNPEPLVSALGQKRTFCAAAKMTLFDHLVGGGE